MPDFEVEMTHTSPNRESWIKSVVVQDCPREQAIPLGITELFKWCEEEAAANPGAVPIDPEAYKYWNKARATGGLLYEIQSNLETFGLTFGIKELNAEPPAPTPRAKTKVPPHRNGTAPQKPQSLNDMLAEHLQALQARQKELSIERKQLQDEYEANRESIEQIVQFLTIAKPKRGRPKNVVDDAD